MYTAHFCRRSRCCFRNVSFSPLKILAAAAASTLSDIPLWSLQPLLRRHPLSHSNPPAVPASSQPLIHHSFPYYPDSPDPHSASTERTREVLIPLAVAAPLPCSPAQQCGATHVRDCGPLIYHSLAQSKKEGSIIVGHRVYAWRNRDRFLWVQKGGNFVCSLTVNGWFSRSWRTYTAWCGSSGRSRVFHDGRGYQ